MPLGPYASNTGPSSPPGPRLALGFRSHTLGPPPLPPLLATPSPWAAPLVPWDLASTPNPSLNAWHFSGVTPTRQPCYWGKVQRWINKKLGKGEQPENLGWGWPPE